MEWIVPNMIWVTINMNQVIINMIQVIINHKYDPGNHKFAMMLSFKSHPLSVCLYLISVLHISA